jgi:hypothetical protein
LRAVLLLAVVPRESRLRRLGSRRIRLVMGCPLGVRGALAPNAGCGSIQLWDITDYPALGAATASPRGADDAADGGAARFSSSAISSATELCSLLGAFLNSAIPLPSEPPVR